MSSINIESNLGGDAAVISRPDAERMQARCLHVFEVECFDRDGNLKWIDTAHNVVTTVGKNEILDKFYKGSAYTAAHYVGLTDGTPTVAVGDTMASHAGWVEIHTQYDESVRQTLTMGTPASGSVSNSASKASFAINATVTVGGMFVATSSTKNETGSILVGVAAFDGSDKSLNDGDTLQITVTATLT